MLTKSVSYNHMAMYMNIGHAHLVRPQFQTQNTRLKLISDVKFGGDRFD